MSVAFVETMRKRRVMNLWLVNTLKHRKKRIEVINKIQNADDLAKLEALENWQKATEVAKVASLLNKREMFRVATNAFSYWHGAFRLRVAIRIWNSEFRRKRGRQVFDAWLSWTRAQRSQKQGDSAALQLSCYAKTKAYFSVWKRAMYLRKIKHIAHDVSISHNASVIQYAWNRWKLSMLAKKCQRICDNQVLATFLHHWQFNYDMAKRRARAMNKAKLHAVQKRIDAVRKMFIAWKNHAHYMRYNNDVVRTISASHKTRLVLRTFGAWKHYVAHKRRAKLNKAIEHFNRKTLKCNFVAWRRVSKALRFGKECIDIADAIYARTVLRQHFSKWRTALLCHIVARDCNNEHMSLV